MGDLVEKCRENPAYGPVGIIVGAGVWYILQRLVSKVKVVEASELLNTFLALLFSGMYIWLWTQEDNPHKGELGENKIELELPLLLAGGYSLIQILPLPESYITISHGAVTVLGVCGLIYLKKGANFGNVMAFLYYAPSVVIIILSYLRMSDDRIVLLANLASVGGMCYTAYPVVVDDSSGVGAPVQVLTVLYILVALARLLQSGSGRKSRCGGRSRSRSSKSRGRKRC